MESMNDKPEVEAPRLGTATAPTGELWSLTRIRNGSGYKVLVRPLTLHGKEVFGSDVWMTENQVETELLLAGYTIAWRDK